MVAPSETFRIPSFVSNGRPLRTRSTKKANLSPLGLTLIKKGIGFPPKTANALGLLRPPFTQPRRATLAQSATDGAHEISD